nr:methyltransferase [Kibdelosporangium banguiense]
MRITSGLWMSKTLVAAHELDLFTLLAAAPGCTVAELADALELHERPTELLVTACAGLGLLERDGEGYRNTPVADNHLVRGQPGYFGAWVDMLELHDYPGWMRLGEALRTNRPTVFDPEEKSSLFDNPDSVMMETFWDAMSAISRVTAPVLGQTVDFSGTRALLDVGGGGGGQDIELCRQYPHLRAAVFDLPSVCELTRPKIEEANLADRITLVPGDFFSTEPLPTGYDTILLSNILHDWAPPDCHRILDKCFAALAPGGALLISELLVADTKDGPLDAALMSLAMLVETFGRNYTAAEYRAWLANAGFADIRVHPFTAPGANGVVLARKA